MRIFFQNREQRKCNRMSNCLWQLFILNGKVWVKLLKRAVQVLPYKVCNKLTWCNIIEAWCTSLVFLLSVVLVSVVRLCHLQLFQCTSSSFKFAAISTIGFLTCWLKSLIYFCLFKFKIIFLRELEILLLYIFLVDLIFNK